MPVPTLTIGSFAFEGLEIPDKIVFQSKQRLVVHHLGSGGSLVDCVGDDYQLAVFSGIFSGLNAASRIRALETLRVTGAPLAMVWSAQALTVIIQKLNLSYLSRQWVPYTMVCYVLGSQASGSGGYVDAAIESAFGQVNDIVSLLQTGGLTADQTQSAALMALCDRTYDTPPTAQLQVATAFAVSLSENQTGYEGYLSSLTETSMETADDVASRFNTFLSALGAQASVGLAQSRVQSILVQAEDPSP
jgi:hypothetical protein